MAIFFHTKVMSQNITIKDHQKVNIINLKIKNDVQKENVLSIKVNKKSSIVIDYNKESTEMQLSYN
jgi:frataxin-like iron-binding protein CyaY